MRFIDIATERRVTVLMVTLAIVLFGFVSLTRLKVNLLPDLAYPTLTVRTELPGAAPLEVENLLTKPIEKGGLGFGTIGSSAILAVLLVGFIVHSSIAAKRAERSSPRLQGS